MKKTLVNCVLALGLICLFTTCHKYPEGGWTNVAIKHLFGDNKTGSQKTWKLKLYEVNGIDSTGYISPGNGVTAFENETATFVISNARAHDYFFTMKVYGGYFNFDKKKRKIEFFTSGNVCKNTICERAIFFPDPAISGWWSIEKLTQNEFAISNKGINIYKITFTN